MKFESTKFLNLTLDCFKFQLIYKFTGYKIKERWVWGRAKGRHGVGEEMEGSEVGIYGIRWRMRRLGFVNWENIEEEDEWIRQN